MALLSGTERSRPWTNSDLLTTFITKYGFGRSLRRTTLTPEWFLVFPTPQKTAQFFPKTTGFSRNPIPSSPHAIHWFCQRDGARKQLLLIMHLWSPKLMVRPTPG